jgi:hypothetical protein
MHFKTMRGGAALCTVVGLTVLLHAVATAAFPQRRDENVATIPNEWA